MNSDIKNINLAPEGLAKIKWASLDRPVLGQIKSDFKKTKALKGLKIAACLHVTAETANLMICLKEAGADVLLTASNPLSTQDEVAASLVKDFGIMVLAINGEDRTTYYRHLKAALDFKPKITLDDGADLVTLLHQKYSVYAKEMIASLEETTTGVIRLRSLAANKKLLLPVVAVNDAKTKHLFDNRYGTGQSTLDGILRATNILIAGKTVVVAGYGWCGRGFAMRARGMGAKVVITEIDAIKALEAAMDGFVVMSMNEASKIGDIFCTLTGNISVIDKQHFKNMKDKAIVCNSGHFDVEINIAELKKIAKKANTKNRPFVDEYKIGNKSIFILAEGRLINLAAAEGHPPSVMDMSFSTQALGLLWATKQKNLKSIVYDIEPAIEEKIAKLKLKSMNLSIDKLSTEQEKYLKSWQIGT
jgi:adenosylhomocysteinase